jgi:hypothetical protein
MPNSLSLQNTGEGSSSIGPTAKKQWQSASNKSFCRKPVCRQQAARPEDIDQTKPECQKEVGNIFFSSGSSSSSTDT